MSIKTNKPSDNKAAGVTSTKPNNGNFLIIGCVAAVFILVLLITMLLGGGDNKNQDKDTGEKVVNTDSVAGSTKQARVYESEDRQIKTANSKFANPVNDPTVSATGELVFYVEPVTNLQMVQTPSGAYPVDSPEGSRYINDFKLLQSASNPSASSTMQNQIQSDFLKVDLEAIKLSTNEQVEALDMKIESMAARIDELTNLARLQNETIVKLSSQIKTIQPITKSSTELAKDLFGKGGDIILRDKNKAVKVDSIVGNKAFVTTKEGLTILVGEGDVIQGTSIKIKKIDAATNTVIAAD